MSRCKFTDFVGKINFSRKYFLVNLSLLIITLYKKITNNKIIITLIIKKAIKSKHFSF